MDRRLEHEIRQIPGVLACSFSGDNIAVLVDPSADRAEVEAQVRELLRSSGITGGLFVLGGTSPIAPAVLRRRRKVSVAGIATAAAFTAGAALAASIALLGNKTPHRPPRAQPPPSPIRAKPTPPFQKPIQKPKPRLTPAEVAQPMPPAKRPRLHKPGTDVVARHFTRKHPPLAMPPTTPRAQQPPPATPPAQQPPPPSAQPPAPAPTEVEPGGGTRVIATEPAEAPERKDKGENHGKGHGASEGAKNRGKSESSHRFIHCDNGHARGHEHDAKQNGEHKGQQGRGHRS